MRLADVFEVLDALAGRNVRCWTGGGWGVDALVGHQTREHPDLDLAVDADDLSACLQALDALGYTAETDWLPVRLELRRDADRWVDVHPVGFDAAGHGRQARRDGGHFDYPPDAFALGTLDGRPVACLSLRQQLIFHRGYDLRPRTYDLDLLEAMTGPPDIA